MLIEMLLLAASCDVAGAALGTCQGICTSAGEASYTICAIEREQTTSGSQPGSPISKPLPKPQRLCSYYVNGTINVPTSSVITAWIDIGSRLCIGDEPPKPSEPVSYESVSEALSSYTAYANKPFAYFAPAREIEVDEPVNFGVNLGGGTHSGTLFGRSAEIRFYPTGAYWQFSDGQRLEGRFVSATFEEPELVLATATVRYRIDYRFPSQNWVVGASSTSLVSNELALEIVDPPRRSLLTN